MNLRFIDICAMELGTNNVACGEVMKQSNARIIAHGYYQGGNKYENNMALIRKETRNLGVSNLTVRIVWIWALHCRTTLILVDFLILIW